MSTSRITRFAARVTCGAAAVVAIAACENPINQRYFCAIEDIQIDGFCLPYEDRELSEEVCKHLCEEAQEQADPANGIHDYDCDDVSVDNATHDFPDVCEVDVDWADVLIGDPDSGLAHRYNCGAPWQAYDYYCPWDVDHDGVEELSEGSYLTATVFQGCGIDSTAGHQSCIDDCADVLASINAYLDFEGVDCSFPVFLCDSLDFPVELEGQVCDAAGMMLDRTGDRADKIVWSTADGGPATRPLACSLSGNCCDAFGPAVCSNLALGTSAAAAAEHITGIAGTVTFASGVAGVPPVVASVTGTVRSSSRSCNNSAGTCPLYLEDLQLQIPGDVRGILFNGVRYDLSSLSARIDGPALGVADVRTRAAKLLGDRVSLRIAATVRIPSKGVSMRVEETPELPAAIDARMSSSGELIALTTSLSLPGNATLTIALAKSTSPNGAAR
jgi:hypothetical protein